MKNAIQKDAVNIIQTSQNTLLLWATGVGKSKPAIDIINLYFTKNPKAKILILVAEIAHIDNWKQEMRQWKCKNINKIDIACYASMEKYKDIPYDLIVCDECHHLSDNRLNILSEMLEIKKFKFLGLSATVTREKFNALQYILGNIEVLKVSLNTAIDKDLLPTPTVNIITCELSDYTKYKKLEEQVNKWKSKYYENGGHFNELKWKTSGLARKQYIGASKTNFLKALVDAFIKKNKRFICFCASIEQAEQLDKEHTLTSKTPAKKKKELLSNYKNEKINRLFAVSMLKEGMNFTNLKYGIISQLDGKTLSFIQRMGRLLRAENPEVFIFVLKGTYDEVYLENVYNNINHRYINVLSFSELLTNINNDL